MMALTIALALTTLPGDDPSSRCPAAELRHLVGRKVDHAVRTRVSERSTPARTRWIQAGSAVTQDWVPERVNIDVASDGRVTRIWCG